MSPWLRLTASMWAWGVGAGCSLVGGIGDYDTDCVTGWQGALAATGEAVDPGVEDALTQFTGVLLEQDVVLVASRGLAGFPVQVQAFGAALGETQVRGMPATRPKERGLSEVGLAHVSPRVLLASAGSDACAGGALCLAQGATPFGPQDVLQASWVPLFIEGEETSNPAATRFHRPAVAGLNASESELTALVAFVAEGGLVDVAWLDEAAFTKPGGTSRVALALERMQGDYVQPLLESWQAEDDAGFLVAYLGARGCGREDGVRLWRFGKAPPQPGDPRTRTCVSLSDAQVDEVSLTTVGATAVLAVRAQGKASLAWLPAVGSWTKRTQPAFSHIASAGRVRIGPVVHANEEGDLLAAWVASRQGGLEVQAQRFRLDISAVPAELVALQRITLGRMDDASRLFVRYDGARASIAVTGGALDATLTLGEVSCAPR